MIVIIILIFFTTFNGIFGVGESGEENDLFSDLWKNYFNAKNFQKTNVSRNGGQKVTNRVKMEEWDGGVEMGAVGIRMPPKLAQMVTKSEPTVAAAVFDQLVKNVKHEPKEEEFDQLDIGKMGVVGIRMPSKMAHSVIKIEPPFDQQKEHQQKQANKEPNHLDYAIERMETAENSLESNGKISQKSAKQLAKKKRQWQKEMDRTPKQFKKEENSKSEIKALIEQFDQMKKKFRKKYRVDRNVNVNLENKIAKRLGTCRTNLYKMKRENGK
ncbi:hypothetical protein niasHS_016363 [Heterodera schachtii]|uniref:Uncharacterized protein n=1 Tax=Heterodera schachtii TaxID=97005 RepID=A0ABD2IER7_HETSC